MNHFQYLPVSGPLSGPSMVAQTENVLNALLAEAREISEVAQDAHGKASEADANATEALDKALQGIAIGRKAQQIGADALVIANNADSVATQAIADAAGAEATGMAADAKAVVAQRAADIALASAKEGVLAADEALAAANTAADSASTALDNATALEADLADLHGPVINNSRACDNLLVHTAEEPEQHPDDLWHASENRYLDKAERFGVPAKGNGHLTVRVDAAGEAVIQMFTDQQGNFLQRVGRKSGPMVTWSDWRDIEVPDHDLTMAVDPVKRLGVSAVSPARVNTGDEVHIGLTTPLCHVCRPQADLTVIMAEPSPGVHKAVTLAIIPHSDVTITWTAEGSRMVWTNGHAVTGCKAGALVVVGLVQIAGCNVLTCLYDEAAPRPSLGRNGLQRRAA